MAGIKASPTTNGRMGHVHLSLNTRMQGIQRKAKEHQSRFAASLI